MDNILLQVTALVLSLLSGSGSWLIGKTVAGDSLTDRFVARQRTLYQDLGLMGKLEFDVFLHASTGLQNLRDQGAVKRDTILTIIDYSQPSTQKRLFVIDLETRRLLFHTLVAHGKNSGLLWAQTFSDRWQSRQSSLGFFLAARTYLGKHGYSLKLKGLEPGFNGNAERRSIVIHGADYVSPDFIRRHGRLGLSWGCPALPKAESRPIIDAIKDGTCLFVYAPDAEYLKNSAYLDLEAAVHSYMGGAFAVLPGGAAVDDAEMKPAKR